MAEACPKPSEELVIIDSVVIFKILKHVQKSNSPEGVLLGWMDGKEMEVTNCFPFPEDVRHFEQRDYCKKMVEKIQGLSASFRLVGWYQAAQKKDHFDLGLFQSLFHHQNAIAESIVLIYDVAKSARAEAHFDAFRLTPTAMDMFKGGDFTAYNLLKINMGYQDLFQKVHLSTGTTVLQQVSFTDIEECINEVDQSLQINFMFKIEEDIIRLMDHLDDLRQDNYRCQEHEKTLQQLIEKKKAYLNALTKKNELLTAMELAPLPQEQLDQLFKVPRTPSCLKTLVVSNQVKKNIIDMKTFCADNIAKWFMLQALDDITLEEPQQPVVDGQSDDEE